MIWWCEGLVDLDSLAMCQGLGEGLIHESLFMSVGSAIVDLLPVSAGLVCVCYCLIFLWVCLGGFLCVIDFVSTNCLWRLRAAWLTFCLCISWLFCYPRAWCCHGLFLAFGHAFEQICTGVLYLKLICEKVFGTDSWSWSARMSAKVFKVLVRRSMDDLRFQASPRWDRISEQL